MCGGQAFSQGKVRELRANPRRIVEPQQFKTTEQRALDEAIQKQAMKEACFSTRSIEEEMRTTVMWRGGGR